MSNLSLRERMDLFASVFMLGKEGAFLNSKLATLLGVVAAASLVVGYRQWREKEQLVAENAQLRTAAEAAQTVESPSAAKEVDPAKDGAAAEKLELLKLRNEVRQLRESTKELERLRAELGAAKAENSRLKTAQSSNGSTATNAPGFVAKENWRFAGYSSPEAAVQSLIYLGATGDFEGFLASLAPEEREELMKDASLTKEKFTAEMKEQTDKLAGYRIVGREASFRDGKVVLSVEFIEVDGKTKREPWGFRREGQEWKTSNRK
jgi:hypothetical protein